MTAQLVKFPECNLADVPAGLRRLAEAIERGEFDDAHNLAYVVDGGDGRIHIGMLGAAGVAGPEAYLLFGCAMRRLEQ